MAYQAIRIEIADTTIAHPDLDPDRASFTVALSAARDQIIKAAGIITDSAVDIVGVIGQQVLASLLPVRRCRTSLRVVKRAISTYASTHRQRPATRAQPQGRHQHQHPNRRGPLTTTTAAQVNGIAPSPAT